MIFAALLKTRSFFLALKLFSATFTIEYLGKRVIFEIFFIEKFDKTNCFSKNTEKSRGLERKKSISFKIFHE
jgi:hypothetical protein